MGKSNTFLTPAPRVPPRTGRFSSSERRRDLGGSMTARTHLLVAIGFALLLPRSAGAADVDFARDVRPILQKNCFRCHGEKKQEGGLRLDIRRRAFAGGDTGPAIVPGRNGELLNRL